MKCKCDCIINDNKTMCTTCELKGFEKGVEALLDSFK